MKNQMSRQAALKALLIAAVVANFSANFAGHTTLHSMNLSSETFGGAPAAVTITAPPPTTALPPSAAAKVVDQGNAKVSLLPVGTGLVDTPVPTQSSAPAPQAAPPPPEAVEDNSPEVVSSGNGVRSELPKICGQRFYVTFREISLNSSKLTEITIQPHTGEISGFRPITYRANGGFELNLDREDVKHDLDSTIVSLVQKHLGHCSEEPVADTRRGDRTLEKHEREDIKAGMKACRLNSHGDALTEVQQTRCHIDELADVSVGDTDNWTARDRAASKVERIVRDDLKKSIKNRLISKDDSKVDEGETLLEDTISTVNDLTAEYNLDTTRMTHVVMELKALKVGGRTYRDANDLSSQIKDAQDDLREQFNEANANAQANPRDAYAQQRLQQVKYEIANRQQLLQTQAQLAMTQGAYNELLADSRLGYVSATDFSQFAQPFQVINTDLQSIRNMIFAPNQQVASSMGAAGLAATQFPNDFNQYRQGLQSQFQMNFGTTVPQVAVAPTLGLNNGMTAYNGMTPAPLMNQMAPASTFSPVMARQLR